MPKGSRGGSKGGGSIGAKGTGVEIEINNKKRQFFVSDTGLLVEISRNNARQNTGNLTTKEFIQKSIDSGKGTFLSKTEVEKRRKKIQKERESNPDYEMGTGTPWENKNNRKAARISRLQSRRS